MEDKLVWGILGSLVTIFVTKLFDIYKTNRDNKFVLQKLYFEKKLIAAESAMSTLYEDVLGIDNFIRVYEKISNSSIEELPYIYQEIVSLQEESSKALKSVSQISNYMYLYFDFDNYIDSDQTNIRKLLDISSQIRAIDSEMEVYGRILKEHGENDLGNYIFEEIKKKYPEYIPKLKELVVLGNKAKDDAKSQLKKIRKEMKRYNLL